MVIKIKVNNNKLSSFKEIDADLKRHSLYIERDLNCSMVRKKGKVKRFAIVLKKLVAYGNKGFIFDKALISSNLTKKEAIRILKKITTDYQSGKEFCHLDNNFSY